MAQYVEGSKQYDMSSIESTSTAAWGSVMTSISVGARRQEATLTFKVRLDDVTWRDVDGEILMLDLRSTHYFGLNATASTLWLGLVEGESRPALIARLVDKFEVDEREAASDVDSFLAELRARALLD